MNKVSMRIGVSMFVLMFSIWACGGSDKAADQTGETTKTEAKAAGSEPTAEGIEFTAKYQCPMHCPGSGSEAYGSCPVCGMHYMYNPNLPGADTINKKLFKENPQVDPDNPKPAAGQEGHGH